MNLFTIALAFTTASISTGAFAVTSIGAGVTGSYLISGISLSLAIVMLIITNALEKILSKDIWF